MPRAKAMRRKASSASQRGVALVTVMTFLVLIMLLALAATMTGITELQVGSNTRLTAEAFTTAEAGAEHAFEIARNMKGDFTDLLRGYDGELRSGDEFQNWPTGVSVPLYNNAGAVTGNVPKMYDDSVVTLITKTTGEIDGRHRALWRMDARHYYELVAYDNARSDEAYLGENTPLEETLDPADVENIDCDRRVVIRSIGYVLNTDTATPDDFDFDNVIASAVVDTVVGLSPYPALIVNGDLDIGQSAQITGALGSIHANDDLHVAFSGGGGASGSATWSNSVADTAASGWNPTSNSGTGVAGRVGKSNFINLPDLIPYNYAHNSDAILFDTNATANQRTATFADIAANSTVSGATATTFAAWLQSTTPAIADPTTGAFTLEKVTADSTYPYGYKVFNAAAAQYTGGGLTTDISGPSSIPASGSTGKTVLYVVPTGTNNPVNLNGGSGSHTTTGVLTVISTGSVLINGNLDVKPAFRLLPPLAPPWAGADITVLAGEDVRFNGTADIGTTTSEGIIYAHEQIHLLGTANVNGQVLAYEKSLVWNSTAFASVSDPKSTSGSLISASDVSGNFSLNHSALSGHLGAFGIVSWRELRDFVTERAYVAP